MAPATPRYRDAIRRLPSGDLITLHTMHGGLERTGTKSSSRPHYHDGAKQVFDRDSTMSAITMPCPLCGGTSAVEPRGNSPFVHVHCGSLCESNFLIAATALEQLAFPQRGSRRVEAFSIICAPLPADRIHVLAWSLGTDDFVHSVEDRSSWAQS
jgi:hypothetical protein